MLKNFLLSLSFLSISIFSFAQTEGGIGSGGFAYGAKGGLTIGTQTWNGFQRNALFSYHGDAFVESLGPWKEKENGMTTRSSFGGQLGYHRKGSSFRNVYFGTNNNTIPANVFHNVSLTLFGKGAFKTNPNSNAYYGLGLRADYTVNYQLTGFGVEGVNKFNYGVWLAGGMEFMVPMRNMGVVLEVNISPDLSHQVFVQPGQGTGFYDINGNQIQTQEQKVINLIFELSVGFKFEQ